MMAELFPETRRLLNEFGKELSARLREKLDEYDINATYNLYNSIEVRVIRRDPSGSKSNYIVALDLADYWEVIEFGRRAGQKFPPIDEIRNWIRVKPIPPTEDDLGRIPTEDQLVFLIARKISRDGIEPRPFVQDSLEELIAQFDADIRESLAEDVRNQLDDAIIGLIDYLGFEVIKLEM